MNAPAHEFPTSLSARLRSETAASHRALEDALAILSPAFDLPRYRETVRGFHAFLHPLLKRAAALIPTQDAQAINPLRHLSRLDRDMSALQLLPRAMAGDGELPAMSSAAQAWGALYVIEGSTLGARILAPHFGQCFGIDADSGSAYFCGDQSQDGQHGLGWPQFRSLLDSRVNCSEQGASIDTARETFGALQRWLT